MNGKEIADRCEKHNSSYIERIRGFLNSNHFAIVGLVTDSGSESIVMTLKKLFRVDEKREAGGYISCDPKEALEANLDDIKKMKRPANTNGEGCEHKNLIREIGCYPQCKDCGFIEYVKWEDESDNDRPSAGHDATVFCDRCNNTVKYKDFIKCHQGKECVNSKFDPVNKPKHYNSHPSGVQCIEIARHMNFNLGNAMKYIWRADEKGNTIEDLEKARWYIDDEISKRKGEKRET